MMRKLIFLLLIVCVHFSVFAALAPKQRIEREFRQLEEAVMRCIYDDMLPQPDLERMNMALYNFMRDNPGVIRMLRVNAGGISVNDINAESPRSAPPRDIGGQRWFRHIVQNRRAYYNMDLDTATGNITLFYAWPLMTGPDRERFSGAFAVAIDFASQAALIDDAPPFQIAHRGRALFQHDWDDVDYNEAPLEVRGTSGLTIRTHRPVLTRLDPVESRPSASAALRLDTAAVQADAGDPAAVAPAGVASPARSGGAAGAFFKFINVAIFILLVLIVALLIYNAFIDRIGRIKFFYNGRISFPKTLNQDKVIVHSMSEMPVAAQSEVVAGNAGGNANGNNTVNKNAAGNKDADNGQRLNNGVFAPKSAQKDHEAISVLLKIMKKEFTMIDMKIQALQQRVNELEKNK